MFKRFIKAAANDLMIVAALLLATYVLVLGVMFLFGVDLWGLKWI